MIEPLHKPVEHNSFISHTPTHHRSVLNQEVSITFKPIKLIKSAIKYAILLLILVLIFYLGTFYGSCDCPVQSTATAATTTAQTPAAVKEAPPESSKFFEIFSNLLGRVMGESLNTTTATTTTSVTETTPTATTTSTTPTITIETPSTTTETTAATTTTDENVITKYTKVTVKLTDIKKVWKGDWGQVTMLDFTIINNENGTIKPEYINMTMQGYDFGKMVPLLPKAKNIPAGGSYSGRANVPNGFDYNEVTTGPLSEIMIGIKLVDSENRIIAYHNKAFDLRGGVTG